MKKLLIVGLTAFVAACSCFECEDEAAPAVTYQNARRTQMDCDYFDGKTCYRYVYRNIQRPVAPPAPVVHQRPCEVAATTSSCGCNSCAPKISETREPVEVVYKKTTYKTVYEPKTFSQVSYERLPYTSTSVSNHETVEVVDNAKVIIDEVK